MSTSEILSNGCDDAPTEAVHPDHILYNKVPKCGSTTLQNIFDVVAESTNMTVTLQFIYHGINMNPRDQVFHLVFSYTILHIFLTIVNSDEVSSFLEYN